MRFRNISLIIGTIASLALVLLSDPDLGPKVNMFFGAQTLLAVKSIVTLSLACLVIHLSRKTLFDYLDLSAYFEKALESSEGAAKALQAVGLFMIAVAVVFAVLVATI